MFRRTYYVQRAERRNEGEPVMRDTSFSSFVCILFIFVVVTCLIVIAANWRFLFLVEDEIEYNVHNDGEKKKFGEIDEKWQRMLMFDEFNNFESTIGDKIKSDVKNEEFDDYAETTTILFTSNIPETIGTTSETTTNTDLTSNDWFYTPKSRTDVNNDEQQQDLNAITKVTRDVTVSDGDLIDLDTTETDNFISSLTEMFKTRTTPFWFFDRIDTTDESDTVDRIDTNDTRQSTTEETETTEPTLSITNETKLNIDPQTTEVTTIPYTETTTLGKFNLNSQYNELSKVKTPKTLLNHERSKDGGDLPSTTTYATETTSTQSLSAEFLIQQGDFVDKNIEETDMTEFDQSM